MTLTSRVTFCTREEGLHDKLASLDPNSFYCTANGVKVVDFYNFIDINRHEDVFFKIHFRLLGGKGGFGSLLRSFRVNKSTNQLMCRDLNGRRLASIDEERKLRLWIEKAAQREKEKVEKRKQKYERLKAGDPKHQFNDPDYIRQKEDILDRTEEAFDEGFSHFKKSKQAQKEKEAAVDSSSSDSDFDVDNFAGSRGGLKRKHKKEEVVEVPTKLVKKTETANNLVDDKDEEPSSDEDEEDAELIHEMLDYFKDKDQQGSSTAEVLSNGDDAPSTAEEAGSGTVSETSKEANEPVPESKAEKKALIFESIDLDDFEEEADLEQLGLDHLKHALEVRGLKCGGSIKERSARLFSVRGLSVDKYPKNIVASKKK